MALLAQRHIYNDVIYSYAVYHNDRAPLAEWLRHHDDFLNQCGPYLDSALLRIDPIARRAYEHLEYSPLINQRIHRLNGGKPHRQSRTSARNIRACSISSLTSGRSMRWIK